MDTPLRIELQAGYEGAYHESLDSEFSDELSFNVKKLFLTLLRETNDADHTVDADVLHFREISQSKTNCDEQYIELFGRRSPAHIQKLCKAYRDSYGETAEAVFMRETSGAFRELLIDLTTPWAVYWARKIRTYLHAGKKSGIVRCFLMNDSVTFNEITEVCRRARRTAACRVIQKCLFSSLPSYSPSFFSFFPSFFSLISLISLFLSIALSFFFVHFLFMSRCFVQEYFKRFKKSMYTEAVGKTSGALQLFVKAKLSNVSGHYKKMETDDLAGSIGDALKLSDFGA